MSVPIVLFVYSRPKHLTKTLSSLKKQKKLGKIYFFIDGAKKNAEKEEINKINKCISIVDKVDWVQKETFIQKENIGLKKSLLISANHVFEKRKHNFVIFLEDDNIILPGFCNYMRLTSNKYKNENKIFSITGYNFPLSDNEYKSIIGDHFFLSYGNTWSLGIWKRSWKLWKKELLNLNKNLNKKIFENILKGKNYILYDALLEGYIKKNNAGSTYFYTLWKYKKLTIFPKYPLVNNIGMDGSGENCIPSEKFLNTKRFTKDHTLKIKNQKIKSNDLIKQSIFNYVSISTKKKIFFNFCPIQFQVPLLKVYIWVVKKLT